MSTAMKTALVLSGGGARGAYEAGVLSYILDELPSEIGRPVRFDILCGTSVGAVHACFLAGTAGEQGATRVLREIWQSFRIGETFRVSGRDLLAVPAKLLGYRARSRPVKSETPSGPIRIPGLFDFSEIERKILERVPWDQISGRIAEGRVEALAIATTQIKSGHTVIFIENREGRVDPWAHDPFVKPVFARIRPEHALASGAIPFFFPVIQIDGAFYCDGSLRLNTPLAPALRLGAERVLVIGVHHRAEIGEEPPPLPESSIGNPAFLGGKLLDALLLDHVDYDTTRLRLLNEILADGVRAYGDEFLEKINEPIVRWRGSPYRIVRDLFLRPSANLGTIAGECFAHLEAGRRPTRWLSRAFLHFASRNAGEEADLLSYFYFDGCYAEHLIELGREDARRQRDALVAFFSDDETTSD